jgi:hypothetical protein
MISLGRSLTLRKAQAENDAKVSSGLGDEDRRRAAASARTVGNFLALLGAPESAEEVSRASFDAELQEIDAELSRLQGGT